MSEQTDEQVQQQQVPAEGTQQLAQKEEQSQQEEQKQLIKQQQQSFNQSEESKDDVQILIEVLNPIEKGSGMSKHTFYTLKGTDKLGEFECQRRFNDFFALREVLLLRWPGIYIPPIPEKQLGGNAQETVAERQRLLNLFVHKMACQKYLYYSEEFSGIFLRSKEADISKQLSLLPKYTTFDLVENFKKNFEIEPSEPPTEAITKMTMFQQFLKRILQYQKYCGQNKINCLYQSLSEQARVLITNRKLMKDSLNQGINQTLIDYEKNTLNDCVKSSNELVFANQASVEILQQFQRWHQNNINPQDKLQDLITIEQRDLEAFNQAIQTREQLIQRKGKVEQKLQSERDELNQVMQGKLSLQAKLSKTTIDEQKVKLETSIAELTKEVDSFKQLYQLVTLVLCFKQIDSYKVTQCFFLNYKKVNKIEMYKKILKEMAQLDQEQCKEQIQFWSGVSQFVSQFRKQ